ncbi:hypothetical protein HanRHA438_Chr06g0277991 [Helianthus annuus]|nr:hypothetical protein HanHA89_Chr06g0236191 [Helianthus annuus]KAJ0738599.1 hypothetical protein HanLR1_Chr06g0220121 [Helianthus annuus]KAJ0741479.1 hypothetical protein HanOQP8_Chr06g0228541 [Helianthus annuus]KAJ0912764.1 hypothetical protein HanRHA438_Chr06g0277991 [Helianthus annuus]KAJ0916232.1 hypothetical protein HanPSC8_Chr06g0259301 [Helianthus annuus]
MNFFKFLILLTYWMKGLFHQILEPLITKVVGKALLRIHAEGQRKVIVSARKLGFFQMSHPLYDVVARESFWWYIATINCRVKTSKVDLSVKLMLPLYQALMLQGRTVRQQPPRRCLTIYFPSRSFFIRDGFAHNGFQSTGQLKRLHLFGSKWVDY